MAVGAAGVLQRKHQHILPLFLGAQEGDLPPRRVADLHDPGHGAGQRPRPGERHEAEQDSSQGNAVRQRAAEGQLRDLTAARRKHADFHTVFSGQRMLPPGLGILLGVCSVGKPGCSLNTGEREHNARQEAKAKSYPSLSPHSPPTINPIEERQISCGLPIWSS